MLAVGLLVVLAVTGYNVAGPVNAVEEEFVIPEMPETEDGEWNSENWPWAFVTAECTDADGVTYEKCQIMFKGRVPSNCQFIRHGCYLSDNKQR